MWLGLGVTKKGKGKKNFLSNRKKIEIKISLEEHEQKIH
jgi:hypothetical protein